MYYMFTQCHACHISHVHVHTNGSDVTLPFIHWSIPNSNVHRVDKQPEKLCTVPVVRFWKPGTVYAVFALCSFILVVYIYEGFQRSFKLKGILPTAIGANATQSATVEFLY